MTEKTQKRGLGAGLGALFGAEADENRPENISSAPIERVEPRADQPRCAFDPLALEELSQSISQFSMIQPITVRRLDSGYYQIIAGERRWRAARLAGLTEVPIRVIEADDRRAMELALVENLQREDLNPIEEAKGYRVLMQDYGMTQEETSQSVGKSRPAIANALRLLNLSPPVMAMVEDGDISAGHARALLGVKNEATQLKLATRVCQESLSVRQAEQLAAKAEQESSPRPEPETGSTVKVNYLTEAEKQLGNSLGRRVKISDGKKRGIIELEYYGNDDREALLQALMGLGKEGGEASI